MKVSAMTFETISAVVDDTWITACVQAGEILIDDDNDWHGHLIRAPKMSSIEDLLRRRRSIAGGPRSAAPLLDARASLQDGRSQPRAGNQQVPSPSVSRERDMPSAHQQSLALLLASSPPPEDLGLGLATPPSEHRPKGLNAGSISQAGPSRLNDESKQLKGKGREVPLPPNSREERDQPPTPPSDSQKKAFGSGRYSFTGILNK